LRASEIHNPELVIAHASTQKLSSNVELTVERGRRHVQATQNRQEGVADLIAIDSICSPVLKVSYRVEADSVPVSTPTSDKSS
jgi:DNA-directed RNA polymerase subunit alpha